MSRSLFNLVLLYRSGRSMDLTPVDVNTIELLSNSVNSLHLRELPFSKKGEGVNVDWFHFFEITPKRLNV